ncbi:DUF4920 domain-containing protein [Flammeovirga sp. MY04]|uniref:DUF4920 domain-containing protein n=1 Tax=Flammeovirga sp. MY04 TaxID=1191459 RepID=UPI0008247C6C|nr:DUF4920 domain-containing protein [Flammeovirga sp. MY04]ANQ50887.2 DUF4920 domain-containing protein [Flammeovirga sp. MY04]
MKSIYLFFLSIILFISCSTEQKNDVSFYGETFETDQAVASTELKDKLDQSETVNIKLEGEITGVCQKKGCWLKMPLDDNGNEVFVKFKDYKFFVPMDASGKKAVINGVATKEVIDVATLKHYAEDAGKSDEEIAAITTPETKYTFMAAGVAIED